MTEVKITKEAVERAAANGCSDVKKVLKDLFPEVFKKVDKINLLKLVPVSKLDNSGRIFTLESIKDAGLGGLGIEIRCGGDLKGRAFILSSDFNWKFETDLYSNQLLVPYKK
jgi:hypothetical protein